MDTRRKIKEPDELASIIERLRKEGKKIVFTNGCFDLIHVGHTRYLKFARSQGDLLIVALNTDASTRRLKGPERPFLSLRERMRIIASFWMVDYVTWFDEDTPWEIINLLKPDVLVKGGEYQISEIVGRDIVWQRGGKVISAPLIPGKATTNIVERIIEKLSSGKVR